MTEISILRRQYRFRAWHRGTREADLLLGPFSDGYLETCSDDEVKAFGDLLEAEDPDLWSWVTGKAPPPDHHNTPVFKALMTYIAARQQA